MRQVYRGWAIALMLVGILSGCNLTEPSPPSRLPQIGREKPRVQQPKPSTREPISSAINNRNLFLGNPSNAAPSVASTDNYLMVKAAVRALLQQQNSHRQLGFMATEPILDWNSRSPRQLPPRRCPPRCLVQSPPHRLHRKRLRQGTHCTQCRSHPQAKRITAAHS
jgi:hypothetical protein